MPRFLGYKALPPRSISPLFPDSIVPPGRRNLSPEIGATAAVLQRSPVNRQASAAPSLLLNLPATVRIHLNLFLGFTRAGTPCPSSLAHRRRHRSSVHLAPAFPEARIIPEISIESAVSRRASAPPLCEQETTGTPPLNFSVRSTTASAFSGDPSRW